MKERGGDGEGGRDGGALETEKTAPFASATEPPRKHGQSPWRRHAAAQPTALAIAASWSARAVAQSPAPAASAPPEPVVSATRLLAVLVTLAVLQLKAHSAVGSCRLRVAPTHEPEKSLGVHATPCGTAT